MFVADVDSGVLRVWSVASSSPLENIQIKDGGFNVLRVLHLPMSSSNAEPEPVGSLPKVCVACAFTDGGVGVYDLSKRTWNHLWEQVKSSCELLVIGIMEDCCVVLVKYYYLYLCGRAILRPYLIVSSSHHRAIFWLLAHLMGQSRHGM